MTRPFLLSIALLITLGCLADDRDPGETLSITRDLTGRHRQSGWPVAGFDLAGTGFNPYEHVLSPRTIDRLDVEWVFDTARAGRNVRPLHGTPVVDADGRVYVGDLAGTFFAIANDGSLRWAVTTDPPTNEIAALMPPDAAPHVATSIIGGAALSPDGGYVVFGDANGRIYARDRLTGEERWTARGLDPNPTGGLAGNSLTVVDDTVLVGMASLENFALVLNEGGLPNRCCTHPGMLIALDLRTGKERWRYRAVAPATELPPGAKPFELGPSGADIWSQPTYDPQSRTVYVSTGQNFSPDSQGRSTKTSDAIIAIDFDDGHEKWVRQFTENDIWVVGVPNPNPATGAMVDMDLGDAPKIYRLADGRKVVGAGQKDGRYHVIDAATGDVVATTQHIRPRSALGGYQTGGAIAGTHVFQHGIHTDLGPSECEEGLCPFQGFEGVVQALSLDGTKVKWTVRVPGSPLVGGLAVANGLVYFQSPVEEQTPLTDSPKWGLYVVDAQHGKVLQRKLFDGRAIGSPAVADGHVYVTTGNGALTAYGLTPYGSVIRLGIR
jgi:polyvinyl alcohol dehydrogenase (cytochrome)